MNRIVMFFFILIFYFSDTEVCEFSVFTVRLFHSGFWIVLSSTYLTRPSEACVGLGFYVDIRSRTFQHRSVKRMILYLVWFIRRAEPGDKL